MRILELITEDRTGKLSSTSLWFNMGNLALTAVFVHSFWTGGVTWEIIVAYGSVVCGSKLGHKWLSAKQNGPMEVHNVIDTKPVGTL